MRASTVRSRSLAVAVGALLLCGVAGGPVAGAPAPPTESRAAQAPIPTAAEHAFQTTRTVTRTEIDASGEERSLASYDITVTADRNTNLRGRERVAISWSGAPASGARASNPYGENGLLQEYPVVVLQCRGVDDPAAPLARRVRPETCWTSSWLQRSQKLRSRGEAPWIVDRYAAPEDRATYAPDPFPEDKCASAKPVLANTFTHLTPFVAADGKVYPACSADTMPPEAAVGASFPPAEVAAYTDRSGRGSTQFEVRSSVENQSLGCSDRVDCTIVVIPIVGVSCDQPDASRRLIDQACRRTGQFQPGTNNFANLGVDLAVSPALWWSESNWRNRIAIPVKFGLPPDACDILDDRAPVGFYGSELLAQAALQWSPAYCLDKSRFNLQFGQMSDHAGFELMSRGDAPAAFVSSKHENRGADRVGYAPTAVTGFGIGYVIDRPDNGGEYDALRLNARLLAKLLTQSYLGSDLGRRHTYRSSPDAEPVADIADNPLGIMADPEFIELNPGLSSNPHEAGAALLSLSNASDVIGQLTSYIAQDADAMAFVNGTPDPWGMRVNRYYRGIRLPVAEWPLLDQYVPETQSSCRQANPGVYFTQLAAPVTNLIKIADALIDGWPNIQTVCEWDSNSPLPGQEGTRWKTGRVGRQAFGARFVLGVVSLGDAERFGLRVARLEAGSGRYLGPTPAAMTAAVRAMEQKGKHGPFVVSQEDLVARGDAYPGTMVVFTTARLRNLPKEQASTVAKFIRIATTEGQRPGRGNGQLPAGYVPIRKNGPTSALWKAAQRTAHAIEAQGGGEKSGGREPKGEQDGSAGAPSSGAGSAPEADAADDPQDDGDGEGDGTEAPALAQTAATPGRGSALGGGLLPALLLLAALSVVSFVGSTVMGARRSRVEW